MIVIRLMGGLGNQMFQYAVGRHLSILNNCELVFDIRHFDLVPSDRRFYVKREFNLDIFELNFRLLAERDIHRLPTLGKSILDKIRRSLSKKAFLSKYTHQLNLINEKKEFEFDESVLSRCGDSYLVGYWQNEQYFSAISDRIKVDFQIKPSGDILIQDLLSNICENNAVCLNVRRGDFLTNPIHGFLGDNYIKDSVNLICTLIDNPIFYVFSDDIDWCKENINLKYPCIFVSHEYAGRNFSQYLMLMMHCKHFIIPNSSFGWWAAWLAKYQKKIVIAPKKWINVPGLDGSKVIPTGWTVI